MQTIIIKLLAMFFPVCLGFFLKKIRFFGPTDYRLLAKIAINITLPCAVVSSFAAQERDLSLLGVTVWAFLINLVMLTYAWAVTAREKDLKVRAMEMFCLTGFNMGNFLIPFAQQFMGAAGVAVTALFDAGNSPMCTSGHYVGTTGLLKLDGKKLTLKDILKKLFSSPPLVVYVLMIILMLAKITIPEGIATVCAMTGNANAFISMFMIGLMFEIRFEKVYVQTAFFTLVKRYIFAVLTALVSYYLLPFALPTRQVLVLVSFAPIPVLSSIFTENVKGDVGLCSFITSCSFIISSVLITAVIMVMHIG